MDDQNENKPNESDEMTNLEKLHQVMMRERDAWKKLLEKLEDLRIKNSQK